MNDLLQQMGSLVEGLRKLFSLIVESGVATTLFVVGFILILMAASFLKKIVNPEPTPRWQSISFFICLGASLLAFPAGIVISLIEPAIIPDVEPEIVIDNLRTNKRVRKLIRMIPYDPKTEPNLSISKLEFIGRPDHKFVFVADYEELRGMTVSKAMEKIGGIVREGQYVSAYIFPVPDRLYPLNARGLLQVVRRSEEIAAHQDNFNFFDVEAQLRSAGGNDILEEIKDLDGMERMSWSWPEYQKFYRNYCEVAQKFRCDKSFSAHNMMSEIHADWHPLGFAWKDLPAFDPCRPPERLCNMGKWEEYSSEIKGSLGARVFMMDNKNISEIRGVYMMQFISPREEMIPIITIK